MPAMRIQKNGYGMGSKKFEEAANCVTAYLGEDSASRDEVIVLHANLDDMTAEEIGFAQEMLWENGALDVYTTAIGMKKNRPGTMLSCICKPADKESCLHAFMKYTTTLGVRFEKMERFTLEREMEVRQTEQGDVHIKKALSGEYSREKAEFEDLRTIAKEQDITLRQAAKLIKNS